MKTVKTTLLMTLIALTLACGYSSKAAPAVAGNMPATTELAPADTTAGSAAFTLTINGSNFNSNAVVNWNSAAQTTHYVGAGQLTADIPASAIAMPGTFAVNVTNPGQAGTGPYGGGGTLSETSTSMTFTVNQ